MITRPDEPPPPAGCPVVGMIGLGLLGLALAERWLSRGFTVRGTDLDAGRREGLRDLGGLPLDDAAAVARACDRLVLCLPTSTVARQVVDEVEPALRAGQIVLDATTGAPAEVEALGARLAARSVAYLDTTISGSSEQARRGDVIVMAGGDPAAFAACADLVGAMSRGSYHLGPCGAGTRMKLASNLVLGLNRAALAEGLAFARAVGLDPSVTLAVLRDSAAYSRVMDAKGSKMIAGDFTPQARLAQHRKDVDLILAEAAHTGAHVPLSTVHRALLLEAEAAGLGAADNSAIVRVFESRPS